jgi:hypothetical protein
MTLFTPHDEEDARLKLLTIEDEFEIFLFFIDPWEVEVFLEYKEKFDRPKHDLTNIYPNDIPSQNVGSNENSSGLFVLIFLGF